MATIKDVAERAGVAPSTISKYLNGGTVREKNAAAIREAIAALDYRVNPFARNLKTQASHSVGVLIPNMTAPFYGTVLAAFSRVMRQQGYHTVLSCYDANHGLERDNLRYFMGMGIDGLLYMPENLGADEFCELTGSRSIPVVMADQIIPGVQIDAVLTENANASYKAICSLIDQGHTRIGIVSGPRSAYTARERMVGYLRALSDRGILYDDALVRSGENTFATGYQGFLSLMALKDPPTAIFSTNYDITFGLITAARERNIRIPDQISVFGYDCVDICSMMTPVLPVVHQPEEEIGRLAGTYLLERIQGCNLPPRQTCLHCELVW